MGTENTVAWTDGTVVDYPPGNPFIHGGGNNFPWQSTEPNDTPGPSGVCVSMVTNSAEGASYIMTWYDLLCAFTQYNYVCKQPLS